MKVARTVWGGGKVRKDSTYHHNNEIIKDDLYTFDAVLNQNVGKSVNLDIYRNGENLSIDIPVEDLEAKKVTRFVRFGGAILHDITPQLRRILFLEADGVYLPHAERGSSFSRVGVQERNGNSKIVILDINGKQIRNLDDFIEACKSITDGQHTYVVVRDFNLFDSSPTPKSLTVNLKFGPLQQFEWNQAELDWKEVMEQLSPVSH